MSKLLLLVFITFCFISVTSHPLTLEIIRNMTMFSNPMNISTKRISTVPITTMKESVPICGTYSQEVRIQDIEVKSIMKIIGFMGKTPTKMYHYSTMQQESLETQVNQYYNILSYTDGYIKCILTKAEVALPKEHIDLYNCNVKPDEITDINDLVCSVGLYDYLKLLIGKEQNYSFEFTENSAINEFIYKRETNTGCQNVVLSIGIIVGVLVVMAIIIVVILIINKRKEIPIKTAQPTINVPVPTAVSTAVPVTTAVPTAVPTAVSTAVPTAVSTSVPVTTAIPNIST